MDPKDLPRPKPLLTVGEPLDTVSIAELAERVAAMQAEIIRIEAEISRKQASKSAADAFFKS